MGFKKRPTNTQIIAIIDRSGSMTALRDDAIGGYNTFLKDQKALPGKASLRTILFDHEHQTFHDGALSKAKNLDVNTYIPRGSTALLDAIGRACNTIKLKKGWQAVVAIMTDGHENCSSEYTSQSIKKLIETKRGEGWEFVFLGADLAACTTAHSWGIPTSHTATYRANAKGVGQSYGAVSRAVGVSRTLGNAELRCSGIFVDDQTEDDDETPPLIDTTIRGSSSN